MQRCTVLLAIVCVLITAAAAKSTITIPLSAAGCNSNSEKANTCISYVQAILTSSCTQSCVIQFEAGTYYLFPYLRMFPIWAPPSSAVSVTISGVGKSGEAPQTLFVLGDISNLFLVSPSTTTRIYFSHFAVDMARMPYSFGIALTKNTFSIPSWALQSQANSVFHVNVTKWPWLASAQAINSYFAAQGRWTADIDDYMISGPQASISYTSEADGSVTGTVTSWPYGGSFASVIGQYVILRHQVYSYQVWTLQGHVDLTIRNVDVYATGGMGLVCIRCGDIDIDGLRISPPRSTAAVPPAANYRPVSITADGVHVENQRIGSTFRLVNSHIEGQGDDCVNVNSPMASVTQVSGRTISVAGYGNSFPFLAGDTVNLISGQTAQFKQQQGQCTFSSSALTIQCPGAWTARVGDLVYAANCLSEGLVANNYFGRNRARGLLLRGLGFNVTGNVFDRNSGPAMFAPVDACVFFEGPFLYNLNFERNTVVANNAGPGMQYGSIALVPQVRQYVNDLPVPNTCVDAAVPSNINVTVRDNVFIHDVYYMSPMPTTYITDTEGVVVASNNVTRYAMPSPSCEFTCVECTGTVYTAGNTCNKGACATCGF